MPNLDDLKDKFTKIFPQKKDSLPMAMSSSGGIGHGIVDDDDMIISKRDIVFHACQIFFTFLAMCCFASVAAFQAHWGIGPSGLSGFAIFVSVTGLLLSTILVVVPVVSEKYDKMTRFARALKEDRVYFILAATGSLGLLLISFITTISAFTEAGCKNPDNDPNHALGDVFKAQLGDWCRTKKAGSIFFWFATIAWVCTFVFATVDWREGRLHRPRDQPFSHPVDPSQDDAQSVFHSAIPGRRTTQPAYDQPYQPASHGEEEDEEPSPFADRHQYQPPNLPAGRQSMDTYGAFNDPVPTGYGEPPQQTSRTMEYAKYSDPYQAVRSSLAHTSPQAQNAPMPQPPNYDYQEYR